LNVFDDQCRKDRSIVNERIDHVRLVRSIISVKK